MPSLDDLEHDSNEDAAAPVKGKRPPEEPEPTKRQAVKAARGREDKPWLDIDNPAIWTGDADED